MNKFPLAILVLALLLIPVALSAQNDADNDKPSNSVDTETCIGCHESAHPGMYEGWLASRHAQTTPAEAMKVTGNARKVSAESIPEELMNHTVGCHECHTLRPDAHADTFEHAGYQVHVVVSPEDCATCHPEERSQYGENIMAHAYTRLMDNGLYQDLIHQITGTPTYSKGEITKEEPSEETMAESCLYCHGTKLSVEKTVERDTMFGVFELPVINGWPNQGAGRINLDGSKGSCTACHTRHKFSMAEARKPYTCKECHDGPDVPAYRVYSASKHGNIYHAESDDWNFTNVPWSIGTDFRAPTCAVCHISLVTDPFGEVIAERSHDLNPRLPWRIFGLIYAHPQPKDVTRATPPNKDGIPLPTHFDGTFNSDILISDEEMARRQENMQATCRGCHATQWVDGHWERFENTIAETNETTLKAATAMIQEAWANGWAKGIPQKESPFDEHIEKVWMDVWLLHSNFVRFASAMAGGGDYGVFAQGRYYEMKRVEEMRDWLATKRAVKE